MHLDVIFPDITSTLQITGCHFGVKPNGWNYPKHHHHLFELLYCQEGVAGVLINGISVTLHQGDWLFMKAGIRHQMENSSEDEGHFSFFNIHFDIDDHDMRKRLSTSEFDLYPASFVASTRLPVLVEDIEKIMSSSLLDAPLGKSATELRLSLSFERKIALQAQILLIITEILALQSEKPANITVQKCDTTIYETDIAHTIEEHLQQLIFSDGSITQISKDLGLSRSQCTKIFSKIYGISPRHYLTQLKLNFAKRLLVSTNRTVENIAHELGFHSVSHFSIQFRRWTGMSPNQFRPKHMTNSGDLFDGGRIP